MLHRVLCVVLPQKSTAPSAAYRARRRGMPPLRPAVCLHTCTNKHNQLISSEQERRDKKKLQRLNILLLLPPQLRAERLCSQLPASLSWWRRRRPPPC